MLSNYKANLKKQSKLILICSISIRLLSIAKNYRNSMAISLKL